VAALAVLHDDDRLFRGVGWRAEALQHQRPIGAEPVEVGERDAAPRRQGFRKIVGVHRRLPRGTVGTAPATVLSGRACVGIFAPGRYHIRAMSTFLTVLLVLAMLGVLGVLGVGVATMIRGGNPRLSNKLMQGRVVMQAVALVLLALLMMLGSNR